MKKKLMILIAQILKMKTATFMNHMDLKTLTIASNIKLLKKKKAKEKKTLEEEFTTP